MTLEDRILDIIKELRKLYNENIDIADDPMVKSIQKCIRELNKHIY